MQGRRELFTMPPLRIFKEGGATTGSSEADPTQVFLSLCKSNLSTLRIRLLHLLLGLSVSSVSSVVSDSGIHRKVFGLHVPLRLN